MLHRSPPPPKFPVTERKKWAICGKKYRETRSKQNNIFYRSEFIRVI